MPVNSDSGLVGFREKHACTINGTMMRESPFGEILYTRMPPTPSGKLK